MHEMLYVSVFQYTMRPELRKRGMPTDGSVPASWADRPHTGVDLSWFLLSHLIPVASLSFASEGLLRGADVSCDLGSFH